MQILRELEPTYIQAGAGVVADSDPESEYQETINKASALGGQNVKTSSIFLTSGYMSGSRSRRILLRRHL